MQSQAPPITEANMPPGPTETPEVSLHGLSRERVREVIMEVQALRVQGATEQNSKELAQLMNFLRSLTDSRAQAQPPPPPPPPVAVSRTDADHDSQTAMPIAVSGDSSSPAVSAGAPQAEPAAPATLSLPTESETSTVPLAFSGDNVAQLRKQIHAFRIVSRNMPLPPQLRQELWASDIPDSEKRLLDALPAGLGTPAGNVAEAVFSVTQPQSQPLPQPSAPVNPGTGQVQLVLPPLPPSLNFVSPHLLLKDKLVAAGDQAARLQRLLVPSITPSGLDVRAMAQEREQRREARIEYRMSELGALPTTISDEQLDICSAPGQKYLRPGLLSGGDSSARLKALIEFKALALRHKQRELRTDVVRSITRASQLGVAGDRTALRRMKKQSLREARLTEKMERQQRQERERREQDQHKQQLQTIVNHGAGLVAWHRSQQQRMGRLGRAVLAFHSKAEIEEQKRMERVARERVQALKAGDEEAYLRLVDKEKDTRISHLISQTDQYLNTLIDAVRRQQQTMASQDAVQSSAGEGGPSWLADNAEMDADEAAAAQSRDYYSVAHRVVETISEQPRILIGGSLKEYQLRGLEWMVSLYNNRLNGILADEMGLGKTIQTISLVTYLIDRKQQNGPFLIIVPLSTITNWILEFEKWAPSVRVIGYKGNPSQRLALQQQIRRHEFQVLLTTYDYVIKDRPILAKINWVHMIIDEGHRMKNTQSKLAFTLTTFYKTRYRLILTGTPLQNNLPELWALLNFVLPNIFSSAQSFDEWFNAPFANSGGQDRIELNEEEQLLIIKRLHKVLRPFLLRRLKKDVEVDLPDKVEHVVRCSMSAVQSRLYNQMLKHGTLFRSVQMDSSGKLSARKSQASFNNTIMQLRKICNHPFVFEQVESRINPTSVTDSLIYRSAGKFELLDRVLSKLLATGHRVLIFFQMTQIMTIMQDFLEWRGIRSLRLDGSTSDDDRREYMRVFNAPDSPFEVFLLSTRAGGQGLNLQTADTVIIFDSDWNPSADAQATDRAHRIGQTKEVRILRLITRGTIEENILARAEFKRDLDGKVIQAGKFDNKTSDVERETFLRSLLRSEEGDDSDAKGADDTANSDEELNDMLARSDEERVIFARMDKERAAKELQEWRDAGHTGNAPERLMTESELPDEYLRDYNPIEERRQAEEEATRDKSRKTKRVYYDDGLSEEQWLDALEDDSVDLDDFILKKRERLERKRKRQEEKLLQQHLRSKLGEGDGSVDVENDSNSDDDDDDDNNIEGADSATPSRSRKRGRQRSSANTGDDVALSGVDTPIAPMAGSGADSGLATPQAGRKAARKRLRMAIADANEEASATPEAATPAPTPAAARKARRKTGMADLLSAEERARLDEVFEQSFKAVEACVEEEYERRRCDLFLDLPSRRDYPDYYVIIRHPIAMKTIRRNVKAGKYASISDFHRDWKLMFDNARTYNEEGSMVYEDACELQRALEETMSRLTGEDYTTPIGTQSPLPTVLSAALALPQQQQQQATVPAGFSAPELIMDRTVSSANAMAPEQGPGKVYGSDPAVQPDRHSPSSHSSLPPVFDRKLNLGDGAYADDENL
ncbi:ATP-dependent DNA helicase Snf21 [Coemansia sp. RSA 2050]|nr:ATP-dependent DNA helicase Snf21 [Coemansia sp. RSA 2050]KAJ2735934.1 ATP-dependent DNA helicase Snf21 [Coemansia sp. BCRC 34962]